MATRLNGSNTSDYRPFALVLIEQIGLPLLSFPFLVIAGAWSAQAARRFGRQRSWRSQRVC